jgi:cytochrome b
MMGRAAEDKHRDLVKIAVWDFPVRLGHWLLVVLLGFSWWSAEKSEMQWHRISGYSILAIVLFRLYWGFAGTSTARFTQFVRAPATVVAYAKGLLERNSGGSRGHNPMGGWSVLLLLATLLLQTMLGLFAVDVDGIESGPLSYLVSFHAGRSAAKLHGRVFEFLEILVLVHLAAVSFYYFYKRQNLTWAMLIGTKDLPSAVASARHESGIAWRAIIGITVIMLVVALVATAVRWS